jgi:hypothetical protein
VELNSREMDLLMEHTRRLRERSSDRSSIESEGRDGRGKKEYAFVRRRRRSRSLDDISDTTETDTEVYISESNADDADAEGEISGGESPRIGQIPQGTSDWVPEGMRFDRLQLTVIEEDASAISGSAQSASRVVVDERPNPYMRHRRRQRRSQPSIEAELAELERQIHDANVTKDIQLAESAKVDDEKDTSDAESDIQQERMSTRIEELQVEIDPTIAVMRDTVNKVHERGQKLGALEEYQRQLLELELKSLRESRAKSYAYPRASSKPIVEVFEDDLEVVYPRTHELAPSARDCRPGKRISRQRSHESYTELSGGSASRATHPVDEEPIEDYSKTSGAHVPTQGTQTDRPGIRTPQMIMEERLKRETLRKEQDTERRRNLRALSDSGSASSQNEQSAILFGLGATARHNRAATDIKPGSAGGSSTLPSKPPRSPTYFESASRISHDTIKLHGKKSRRQPVVPRPDFYPEWPVVPDDNVSDDWDIDTEDTTHLRTADRRPARYSFVKSDLQREGRGQEAKTELSTLPEIVSSVTRQTAIHTFDGGPKLDPASVPISQCPTSQRNRTSSTSGEYSHQRGQEVGTIAAIAGIGALAYSAGRKNEVQRVVVEDYRDHSHSRSTSRERTSVRGRLRSVIVTEESRGRSRSLSKHADPKHRDNRIAQVGLVSAAVAGLVQRQRSRSRGRKAELSRIRDREDDPIAAELEPTSVLVPASPPKQSYQTSSTEDEYAPPGLPRGRRKLKLVSAVSNSRDAMKSESDGNVTSSQSEDDASFRIEYPDSAMRPQSELSLSHRLPSAQGLHQRAMEPGTDGDNLFIHSLSGDSGPAARVRSRPSKVEQEVLQKSSENTDRRKDLFRLKLEMKYIKDRAERESNEQRDEWDYDDEWYSKKSTSGVRHVHRTKAPRPSRASRTDDEFRPDYGRRTSEFLAPEVHYTTNLHRTRSQGHAPAPNVTVYNTSRMDNESSPNVRTNHKDTSSDRRRQTRRIPGEWPLEDEIAEFEMEVRRGSRSRWALDDEDDHDIAAPLLDVTSGDADTPAASSSRSGTHVLATGMAKSSQRIVNQKNVVRRNRMGLSLGAAEMSLGTDAEEPAEEYIRSTRGAQLFETVNPITTPLDVLPRTREGAEAKQVEQEDDENYPLFQRMMEAYAGGDSSEDSASDDDTVEGAKDRDDRELDVDQKTFATNEATSKLRKAAAAVGAFKPRASSAAAKLFAPKEAESSDVDEVYALLKEWTTVF